jgi:hypothetical protein
MAELKAVVTKRAAARASQAELRGLRERLNKLEEEQRFAEDIAARFGSGVGLLQGGYGFVEKSSGRPLRYQGLDQLGHPFVDQSGDPLVTVEGTGPPVVIFYAGTGFLLDQAGAVLTNRHLVTMWEHYEPAQRAIEAGFEPRAVMLRIFFPGVPEPFKLEVAGLAEAVDLAILRTDRARRSHSPARIGVSPGHAGAYRGFLGGDAGLRSRLRQREQRRAGLRSGRSRDRRQPCRAAQGRRTQRGASRGADLRTGGAAGARA